MQRTVAQAFNEWMRRYIETPEQFAREFQAVIAFNAATKNGEAPKYGDDCALYLQSLIDGN